MSKRAMRMLSVYANDPDLFNGQPAERVAAIQQASARALQPFSELIARNSTNWLVVCGAAARWAAKVFPDVDPATADGAAVGRDFQDVPAGRRDAASGWQAHLESLESRSAALNARRFRALNYRGPGTDLTIGLPDDHLWVSGRSVSRQRREIRAQHADRRSLHHAAQGSGRRRRASRASRSATAA